MISKFGNYVWPAISGLMIAVVLWLFQTDFGGNQPPRQDDLQSLAAHGDWVGPASYSAAVRNASPSVATIYTWKTVYRDLRQASPNSLFESLANARNPRGQSTETLHSQGTGVVVSVEGYILTNEHVITDATQILVTLYDGRTARASIVGTDTLTDLAILKIDLDGLNAISIGDPDNAQVGDVVLAIGNPRGLAQTVTQGILSATGRNLINMNTLSFLQTDAAINEGNSGGPLVDVQGRMIGINSRTFQDDGSFGLSFAIPSDVAIKVIRDILTYGKVIRGWLGVTADMMRFGADDAAEFGVTHGMVITELYSGGPAHRAGLEPGDIILSVDGVRNQSARQIHKHIENTAPGARVEFEVLRLGKHHSVTVQIDVRPDGLLG